MSNEDMLVKSSTPSEILVRIALEANAPSNRLEAVNNLTELDDLVNIALKTKDEAVGLAAVKRIFDQTADARVDQSQLLGRVAASAASESVALEATRCCYLIECKEIGGRILGVFGRKIDPSMEHAIQDIAEIQRRAKRYSKPPTIRLDSDDSIADRAQSVLVWQAELNQKVLGAGSVSDRLACVARMLDTAVLTTVSTQDPDEQVRRVSRARLSYVKSAVILEGALRRRDQKEIATISRKDENAGVRQFAIRWVQDPEVLAAASTGDEDPRVRAIAVENSHLSDQALLSRTALNDRDVFVRRAASRRLTNCDCLVVVAAQDSDAENRYVAALQLASLGDFRAVDVLRQYLPDWHKNKSIVEALDLVNWQPASAEDKVYSWIGRKDSDSLKANWEMTCQVLITDAKSGNTARLENAVKAIIATGERRGIYALMCALDEAGTDEMATMFYNCGENNLRTAAEAWARRHGKRFVPGSGSTSLRWGEW